MIKLIGESPVFLDFLNLLKKIAATPNITTLIEGENGTGKGDAARLIHELSVSPSKPFIDINCGGIPESLLETELFGHEKGSFTSAYATKKGLFEVGHGGTIFLDEVGATSLSFQSKLLKVVEQKTFRRIGGVEELKVSPRIIAATNIDLQQAVNAGKFRDDLYFRLHIGSIKVPPLRERGEDIVLLANYFVERCNNEYNRSVKGLSDEAIELIRNYPWPGNVRQLRNTIERAVLLESDEWIEADDLNLDYELNVKSSTPIKKKTTTINDLNSFTFPTKGIALEELEKGIINSAIKKASGNLSQAARLLKISRGKLRYRLEKLGMEEFSN